MSLIWPWMLPALLLVPGLVWLYLRLQRRRREAAASLGSFGVLRNNAGERPDGRRHVPPALFLCGVTLLLFGLTRPEVPVTLPRIEGTVILAFDVSSSMLAEDFQPTRLDAAKTAAKVFVENQPSSIQLGVVAFGNGGLVVQPPTYVQADVIAAIERLSPQGGTSLGQGIFTALNSISETPITLDSGMLESTPEIDSQSEAIDVAIQGLEGLSSAVILILSDGENTEPPDPLSIAQIAADAGVRLYTVGIGSEEGSVLDIDGYNVVTQLNEATLEEISSLTNGAYFRATDEDSLEEIYRDVDLQLTIAGEKMEITSIIAGLTALLFIVGAALSMLWFGRIL